MTNALQEEIRQVHSFAKEIVPEIQRLAAGLARLHGKAQSNGSIESGDVQILSFKAEACRCQAESLARQIHLLTPCTVVSAEEETPQLPLNHPGA